MMGTLPGKKKGRSLRDIFLYAGLSREEYDRIRPEIDRSNRVNLVFFSTVAAVMIVAMFLLSFMMEAAEEFRWLYLTGALLSALCAAGACWLVPRRPPLLGVIVMAFIAVVFLFGIALGTFCGPEKQSVTFIVLLLTVPLLFILRPLHMIIHLSAFVAVFVAAVLAIKQGEILLLDVVNTVVFAIISAIVSTYMMNVKCERYLFEQEVVRLSETDLLTGLRSRNAYEQQLPAYPGMCRSSLGCAFVDANGLHELNNTQGHEAGDVLLRFVAKQLLGQFDARHIYRIGGDEYVCFAPDTDKKEIVRRICEVASAAEAQGYHISVGICLQRVGEICMDELIRDAEKRMYADKAAYYARQGTGRAARGQNGRA